MAAIWLSHMPWGAEGADGVECVITAGSRGKTNMSLVHKYTVSSFYSCNDRRPRELRGAEGKPVLNMITGPGIFGTLPVGPRLWRETGLVGGTLMK